MERESESKGKVREVSPKFRPTAKLKERWVRMGEESEKENPTNKVKHHPSRYIKASLSKLANSKLTCRLRSSVMRDICIFFRPIIGYYRCILIVCVLGCWQVIRVMIGLFCCCFFLHTLINNKCTTTIISGRRIIYWRWFTDDDDVVIHLTCVLSPCGGSRRRETFLVM